MSWSGHDFVDWREEFISQERGSRVVHYFLDDSLGKSFLAVIGTERSLRHMLYVISEDFAKFIGSVSEGSGSACLKWRSRREVVDWLTSFLPKQNHPHDHPNSPRNELTKSPTFKKSLTGLNGHGSYSGKELDHFNYNLKSSSSDIVWTGTYWICAKQLRHYEAFYRNGTTIPSHSFVLVMSEEEDNCYLAYLEDMYEDKKGQKKVKVRWFHRHKEVAGGIPPPSPHPREVFITPYSQVISAECVDDLATVLTPEHYEKCLAALPYTFSAGIYLCYRQYNKSKFKPFDLCSMRGYFDQAILSNLDIYTICGDEEEEFHRENISKHGSKRIRSVRGRQRVATNQFSMIHSGPANHIVSYEPSYFKFPRKRPAAFKFIGGRPCLIPPFKTEEKIESLCQDSGIRGCWFRCTILQLSHRRLKVRYDDVQNEDGNGNLEEWILAFRPAAPDKLGMRCSGRLTVRPHRPCDCPAEGTSLEIGTPVDAWWNDGWWEGVVIGVDNCGDDGLQVYFPGEDLILICQRSSLRISKDWIEEKWVDIEARPDVLSIISAVGPVTKLSPNSTLTKGPGSRGSALSGQKDLAAQNSNLIDEERQVVDDLSGPSKSVSIEPILSRVPDPHGSLAFEQKDNVTLQSSTTEIQVAEDLSEPSSTLSRVSLLTQKTNCRGLAESEKLDASASKLNSTDEVMQETDGSSGFIVIKWSDSVGSVMSEQNDAVDVNLDATEGELQAADVLACLLETVKQSNS